MTKPDRIACEVPFCRRTAPKAKYEEGTRIICWKHWRLGDAHHRKRYSRANRLIKRGVQGETLERCQMIADHAWERIRIQAIERAGGIG
ncbi:MAG TPA: hypothetical protein VM639_24520 [Dongiaceae bacterium]|nr:hypothetical protein [Dongiaceae bacterium]